MGRRSASSSSSPARFATLLLLSLLLATVVALASFASSPTTLAQAKDLEGFGDEEVEEEFVEEEDDGLREEGAFSLPRRKGSREDAAAYEEASDVEVEGEEGEESAAEDYNSGKNGKSGFEQEAAGGGASGRGSGGAGSTPTTSRFSEWDEDEFEGVPPAGDPRSSLHPGAAQGSGGGAQEATKKAPRRAPPPPRKPLQLEDLVMEGLTVLFLLAYGLNYFYGRSVNEKIALAWADQFACEESIFEKNFSLLGTGDKNEDDEPLLIKEGPAMFKFYASGRRYCESMLITLMLRSRHDLFAVLWNLLFPAKDRLLVDVHMNEDDMPPFVLAVVRKRLAKQYLKDHDDLKEYATKMDFSGRQGWLVDELVVFGDSREAANEVLSDIVLEQILGEKAFGKFAQDWFSVLHFTDQAPTSVKKKILHFEFVLPPARKMAELGRLMASVIFFIDAVGRLSLSPAAKAKAEAARSRALAATAKELHEQRMEEMQRRREERRRAEEARMSPEELAKKKEKERLKDLRPRAKLTRVG